MSGEHTSTAKTDHEATEEHDWLIVTGTMSGETTSNRKESKRPLLTANANFCYFRSQFFKLSLISN